MQRETENFNIEYPALAPVTQFSTIVDQCSAKTVFCAIYHLETHAIFFLGDLYVFL